MEYIWESKSVKGRQQEREGDHHTNSVSVIVDNTYDMNL